MEDKTSKELKDLVEKAKNGDKEAFSIMYQKFFTPVYRYIYFRIGNKEDAEDLTQEVLVNVYQSLKSFKGQSTLSTWIYRIATNASLNFVRNKLKRNIFQRIESIFGFEKSKEIPQMTSQSDNPEQLLINKESKDRLFIILNSLPEKQRIAFTLSKYDDLSQHDIALVMDITEGAVESLLQRAKANLQKKLTTFKEKK